MYTPVTMHKAGKYAIDMRCLQEGTRKYFMQCFGCARKLYNLYVDHYYNALEAAGYTSGNDIPDVAIPKVTVFKKDFPYMKDADSLALANARLDFQAAVQKFKTGSDHVSYTKRAQRRAKSGTEPLSFRGLKGMPKFHAKAMGYFSYTTTCQYPTEANNLKRPTIRLKGDMLHLPKVKGDVKLVLHRPLPENAVIGNATISMDTDGMFYASIEYSYVLQMDISIRDAALNGNTEFISNLRFLGLDYSQQGFYAASNGQKANAPHWYHKAQDRLALEQRRLSHMQPGSKNYERQKLKVGKIHKKVRNQRRDYVFKEADRLARGYDVVCVEDIDLRAMGQCLHLGKNLHDNGFGMFRDILACKLEEKGSCLVRVGKWFASSQTCSCCGHQDPAVKDLKVRNWTCPECGAVHDRDINAAINIKKEGLRIFPEYMAQWLEDDRQARSRAENLSAARRKKKSEPAT